MDPDAVGSTVLDVIREGRFWVFGHAQLPETALKQAQAMAADATPIDGDSNRFRCVKVG